MHVAQEPDLWTLCYLLLKMRLKGYLPLTLFAYHHSYSDFILSFLFFFLLSLKNKLKKSA